MLKRFSKIENGNELKYTCSFTSLQDYLDNINVNLSTFNPTEKVILLRCLLCSYLYLGERKPKRYSEVGVFTKSSYYTTRVYRNNSVEIFAPKQNVPDMNAPIYSDENGYDKFNLSVILKGEKLQIGTDSGGVMKTMTDGGIGYDFLKVIREQDSFSSGVFGAVGVSTREGYVINASGFLIKSYVSDENINKKFKDITEQIYPSRDLFKIEDFFNKFEIDPEELSLDFEIKTT